jgi:hypothetical protein
MGSGLGPTVGTVGGSVPQTTLSVATTDAVDPVITAVNFNINVTVGNIGANTANNITCTVTLDASLTYVSSAGTGWATGVAGQVVTATRASIAAVDSAPTLSVTVTSGATALTATTTVTAIADNAPLANDSENTVVKLVTKDAGDGKRYPATPTEFADLIAYHIAIGTANVPNITIAEVFNCQEPSGNLAGSTAAFTLTATGAGLAYQQTIGTSTRKAVKTTTGTAGLFQSVEAGLPNLLTTSHLVIWVGSFTLNAARRDLLGIGTAATTNMLDTEAGTGVLRAVCSSNVAAGASDKSGVVRFFATQLNRTGSLSLSCDDTEKLTPTFVGTVAGQSISLGNYKFGACTALYSYIVTIHAANAEITATQLKALGTIMGHTITWS